LFRNYHSKNGVVFVSGGYAKKGLDSTLQTQKTNYLSQCSTTISNFGLTIFDSLTTKWAQAFIDSGGNICFDNTLPDLLREEHSIIINNSNQIII